jgi:glycosyltransferase involved in cell wall biosynthesis
VRIAHISDCYLPRLGGIEVNVSELAERQRAVGHEVTVITSTPAGSLGRSGIIRLERCWSRPGRIVYLGSHRVRRLLRDGGYDVIHAHASAFSPLAYLATHHAAVNRIPTVLTVHSLWANATPLFRVANRFTRWSHWPVQWTAVSEAAAAGLRGVLADRAEVTVVPNGVDPHRWRVRPIVGSANELRVVAVGRLAPRKRTIQLAGFLLDARRYLPDSIRLSVEIVGDGPDRQRLERYLRRHGMTEWVRVRGALNREDIRVLFARSDLFVAPAVLESFGIAALEARCAGLPVLARSGTGVAEFIDHGIHGWLVDSDRQMTETITNLALHRHRLEQVAAHNRAVVSGIDWTTALGRYSDLYLAAVAGRRMRTIAVPSRPHPALTTGT